MKKWWIGLMMLLAMMLLLIPGVAMAEADGPPDCFSCNEVMEKVSVTPYERYHVILWECKTCGNTQKTYPNHTWSGATCVGIICTVCHYVSDGDVNEFNHVNSTITGYQRSDPNEHIVVTYCDACRQNDYLYEAHTFGGWTSSLDGMQHIGSCVCGETTTRDHTGGNPTCTTPAMCTDCGAEYYGDHNWSDWLPNSYNLNLHYRYCLNSGCYTSESEPHDGNANCVTSATCSICHTSYKDTTNHKGPLTYTYEKYDESFHKRIETCTACGNKTGNVVTTKHEESNSANCTTSAYCAVCESHYGDPNPNVHSLVQHDAQAPTCTESGWEAYETCKYCEYTTYKKLSPQHDLVQHDAQSPTCTEVGWEAYETCKRAGCTYTTYAEIPAQKHDVVQHDAQAPTCTEVGWEAYETCTRAGCTYTTYSEIKADPNAHVGTPTTTYAKTSETRHTAKISYSICGHTVDGESTDHMETTAATCITAAYCEVCESSYGDPDPDAHDLVHHDAQAATCTESGWAVYDTCKRAGCTYSTYAEIPALGHDLVQHDAQAPTCTEVGWYAYEVCSRCSLSTYAELAARSHWYGEWTTNGDATQTAACKRGGCSHQETVRCAQIPFVLLMGDERVAYVFCPVCGTVSDGAQLALAQDAAAEAVFGWLPAGEVVVRIGALESGETMMSVAFEYGGTLTQSTGQVKFTLSAGLLDGYALYLCSEDGTETELTLDVQGEEASFVLDFTDAQSPAKVIHLVPVA
ncbi:MAG: hypothetical protein SOZ59_05530 [Candidatus Limivivens sp.]|nr:hypothetical protein [Candidatus Limivivens sp.]